MLSSRGLSLFAARIMLRALRWLVDGERPTWPFEARGSGPQGPRCRRYRSRFDAVESEAKDEFAWMRGIQPLRTLGLRAPRADGLPHSVEDAADRPSYIDSMNPMPYQRLVCGAGWTHEEYAGWLEAGVSATVLPRRHAAPTRGRIRFPVGRANPGEQALPEDLAWDGARARCRRTSGTWTEGFGPAKLPLGAAPGSRTALCGLCDFRRDVRSP